MIPSGPALFVRLLPIVAIFAGTAPAAAQDAAAGGVLFKQRCQGCHVTAPDAKPVMAPDLAGVVGRKAGSSGFATYSPALAQSKLVWTSQTLDAFLAAPGKLVPGTRMFVSITDAKQRADMIAYLKTLPAK